MIYIFEMTDILVKKVISGGQTGVDRAALDFASKCGLDCGGWCPKGRLALDGRIADKYPLQETPSASYSQRTKWNVKDSDGTLIISRGVLNGGTALTNRLAKQYDKPCLIMDLDYVEMKRDAALGMLLSWLAEHSIKTLNIAGPREREKRGIYSETLGFLVEFWEEVTL
jgi:hypothetical protein